MSIKTNSIVINTVIYDSDEDIEDNNFEDDIEEFDYEGNNVIFIPTYPACDKGCKLKFEPTN